MTTTTASIATLAETVYRPVAAEMSDDALRTAFADCHKPLRDEAGDLRSATDAEIAFSRAVRDEFRSRFVL